jgi:hypothetical protein
MIGFVNSAGWPPQLSGRVRALTRTSLNCLFAVDLVNQQVTIWQIEINGLT